MRFTKEVIGKVLKANEGFEDRTYYKSRNKEEENFYKISEGLLHKRSVGKTSWGGSHYDETEVCDLDQTRRFLRDRQYALNLNI